MPAAETGHMTPTTTFQPSASDTAIDRIVAQLRTRPHYQRTGEDELLHKAHDMYAMVCRKVHDGIDSEHLAKIAELLGEPPEELVARLS